MAYFLFSRFDLVLGRGGEEGWDCREVASQGETSLVEDGHRKGIHVEHFLVVQETYLEKDIVVRSFDPCLLDQIRLLLHLAQARRCAFGEGRRRSYHSQLVDQRAPKALEVPLDLADLLSLVAVVLQMMRVWPSLGNLEVDHYQEQEFLEVAYNQAL